ncbi:hypothetical protein, partial [Streptomyces sp. NPDC005568]|uniref:hypothetical protein n=1 Tax=Streptomyces sp. NPDC005568 TaxID=3156887 RepID=UPI0033B2E0DF
ATFNQKANKVVFTDELGGSGPPTRASPSACRAPRRAGRAFRGDVTLGGSASSGWASGVGAAGGRIRAARSGLPAHPGRR